MKRHTRSHVIRFPQLMNTIKVKHPNRNLILLQLSLCNYIAVDETVKYVPDPSDPQRKTLLRQEAVVTVQGVPLGNRVENLMTNTISVNARKGRQAIEWVISKIEAEVQELKNLELINQTKKSIDDFTSSAKKSMDELSTAAKKSFDSFAGPPNQKLPKF